MSGAILASCGKEAVPSNLGNDQNNPPQGEVPTPPEEEEVVNLPQGVELNDEGQLLSFGATIEIVDTKVSVAEDGTVSWVAEDLVKVCVGDQVSVYRFDGEKFVPNDDQEPVTLNTDAYLYYPASAYEVSGSTATLSLNGASSRADLGDKNPMGAVLLHNLGDPVAFKNLCSVLRVQVTGERTLNSLVLSNTSANIAGSATVSWIGSGEAAAPSLSIADEATSQTITEEVDLTAGEVDFYFIVPSATLDNMKLTANLNEEDENGLNSFVLSRNGSLTMSRSTITKVSFYASIFHGGAGTEENPYKIADVRDFMNIHNYCKNGYDGTTIPASYFLNAHYKQVEDIDFGGKKLTPIGSADAMFAGVYNGDSKSLTNFNVDITAPCQGLWAYTDGATFTAMAISNSKVDGTGFSSLGTLVGNTKGNTVIDGVTLTDVEVKSTGNTGGLVGRAESGALIKNCSLLNKSVVSGLGDSVGGIVGWASCTIENCTNAAKVSHGSAKLKHVAGIAGDFDGDRIENCSNTGTVTGKINAGGIVGKLDGAGVVLKCYNTGSIKAEEDTGTDNKTVNAAAGGIAGLINENAKAKIEECYNHGAVESTYAMAGGIVGRMLSGTVNKCYSGKSETLPQIKSKYFGGGIVGLAKNNTAAVLNCAASATVGCAENYAQVGGIAGSVNNAVVANCVALAAKVWGNNNTNSKVGAVVGNIEGGSAIVHNCYSQVNNTTTVGYSTNNGSSVTSGGNVKRGGVFGYFYNGTVKDCYYTAGGPGAGSESTQSKTKTGNFKQITNNAKNGTADESFSNFANGQAGGSMRLKAALTKAAQGQSYNGVALSDWTGKRSDSEQAYPSVLATLGENFRDN